MDEDYEGRFVVVGGLEKMWKFFEKLK